MSSGAKPYSFTEHYNISLLSSPESIHPRVFHSIRPYSFLPVFLNLCSQPWEIKLKSKLLGRVRDGGMDKRYRVATPSSLAGPLMRHTVLCFPVFTWCWCCLHTRSILTVISQGVPFSFLSFCSSITSRGSLP